MSITLPVLTAFTLTWTLTDSSGNAVNAATLTATLYAGRSPINPVAVPGTPVAPIINITLNYVVASAGIYSAAIPGTLNPAPDGTGYTLVLDGVLSAVQIYHTEEPVVVETVGSKLDLTTVDLFKAWAVGFTPGVPTADDAMIQSCITAWGSEFLIRTGQGDMGGDFTQSPFNSICTWNEVYDGCGTPRLMLRNRPVRTVSSLLVNGIAVQQSTAYPSQGFVIDGSRRSISLRGGFGFGSWLAGAAGPYHAYGGGGRFPDGNQNIAIIYTAGYASTPADITQLANQVIFLNYKRRNWVGELSRSVAGGGGSITFGNWDLPPGSDAVMENYSRTL